MARFLLLSAAVVAVHGLRSAPNNVLAPKNQTAPKPNLAMLQDMMTTGEPWDDVLSLLQNIKRRYLCEDQQASAKEASAKVDCDAAVETLEGQEAAAASTLSAKTGACGAIDRAVSAKQVQIDDATKAKGTAEGKIGGFNTLISDGQNASSTKTTTFEKERDETKAAIELVGRLIDGSADLTLAEMGSKLAALPAGHAKEMGALALVTMQTKVALGANGADVTALQELLTELAKELKNYLDSLVDVEGTRLKAWGTMKKGLQKDVVDQQAIIDEANSNIDTYGTEMTGLLSDQTLCRKHETQLTTIANDAAEDVVTQNGLCTTAKESSEKLVGERTAQLRTVDGLLKMLQENEGLASHVKDAVSSLKAQTVADYECPTEQKA